MTEPLKIGERVRVLDSFDGEVTYGPFKSSFGRYTMYVVKDGSGVERSQTDSDLKPLPKFAIGDEVRNPLVGIRGSIVAGPFIATGDGEPYWIVEQPDGRHSTPREDGLTRVEAPAEPREVKVGDRVRVVRATYASLSHGRTGEVTDVGLDWRSHRGDPHPFRVKLDDGDTLYVAEVELLDEVAANTYTHDGVTYDLDAEYRDKDGDTWRFVAVQGVPRGGMNGRRDIDEYSDSLMSVVGYYGPLTKI
ncbi:phiSA1p31-related protein [Streptomyces sp. NPDC006326]|uniref:phiSA1p31-related protein n=1 Tax=Streptomyces sp. NPDC006326 TaxID=3156752 RepID=UPI0033B275C8